VHRFTPGLTRGNNAVEASIDRIIYLYLREIEKIR